MAISSKENWLHTVRRTNPEWMPYSIALTTPLWLNLREELEKVVVRHPKTWPNYKPGPSNWGELRIAPHQTPGRDFVDQWGSVWRTNVAGMTGTVIKPVLEDLSKLDSFTPPDPETYNGGWGPMDWNKVA